MKELIVGLGARAYPIKINTDTQIQYATLKDIIKPNSQILIVTNDTVAPLYLDYWLNYFKTLTNAQVNSCVLPDGEVYKTLDTVNIIYNQLLAQRYSRDCFLVALGGGVIGDMTGYAAATYQRGVGFIQIPTTLLAQVDSSVGGKTGVNHPLGKNMIGAFKQPQLVLIQTATLDTLPERELAAGLAEVIKYALIMDAEFFNWLEEHIDQLLARDPVYIEQAVYKSCQYKADIVAADEEEQGERALLNLGHTFGHAIETAMGYGNWLHGEAVAVGMVMAADVSHQLGWLTDTDVQRIKDLLIRAQLPIAPPNMSVEQFKELMMLDKKVKAGQLRLILLKQIGKGIIYSDTPETILNKTLGLGIA